MECFNEFFIENEKIKERGSFEESFLKEGKSLYEVIRIIDGAPLFLKSHLERFYNSAKLEGLNLWLDEEEIKENINRLIEINKVSIGNIKLVFNFNKGKNNNFLCYFLKHNYPEDIEYKRGVKTILYHGERENPNAKVINMDFRKIVGEKIKEEKAYEAILVDRNGYITEGSKSNIFMIKDGKVITAPIEKVLPGITRQNIIDVCKNLNLKVGEEKVHYKEIYKLEGLFISGTSPKVLPIKSVDEIEFKSSENKLILSIMEGYNKAIEEDVKGYKNKE
ncbi:aminotransferase class IV [Clostridium sporogenes]|uniref:Aminotransferase class IV n=2 Tax=Clostridium TaxID=1485 RepID=A0AAE4Z4W4_CLOSG|nr:MULTISPECIES: aminotransferase class IV [Clostridium]MBE6077792.1 aminotransferase class IV [Clostridium lundense]MDU2834386.1 aminotransferase class IV [Clostridium botulinum]EDU36097.1 aminotransferase, class IV [Clostridium sporogenes ATCC 15579]KIS24551.1 aminotransferase, class IV [Clostridium botulinum B2 450]MCW6094097.1 aminotransferase class IV [Clostridium sporogenes]